MCLCVRAHTHTAVIRQLRRDEEYLSGVTSSGRVSVEKGAVKRRCSECASVHDTSNLAHGNVTRAEFHFWPRTSAVPMVLEHLCHVL